MKTIAQAHDELLIAIAILEEKKTDADNARKDARMRRELDILESKIRQAERELIKSTILFFRYLEESKIKF